jgi:hypothetical protein
VVSTRRRFEFSDRTAGTLLDGYDEAKMLDAIRFYRLMARLLPHAPDDALLTRCIHGWRAGPSLIDRPLPAQRITVTFIQGRASFYEDMMSALRLLQYSYEEFLQHGGAMKAPGFQTGV